MALFNKSLVYHLFFFAYCLVHWPGFRGAPQPSVYLGPVNLYPVDICFLILSFTFLFGILRSVCSPTLNRINISYHIPSPNVFILFLFLYLLVKLIFEHAFTTLTIRAWIQFSTGYLWVFVFPYFVDSYKKLRGIILTVTAFAVYIFVLHIYRFSTRGYELHAFGGYFVPFIGTVFFILRLNCNYLKIKPVLSNLFQLIILVTILLVGHRSGFLALILGLTVLLYYRPSKSLKYVVFMVIFLTLSVLALSAFYPSLIEKSIERASTTFDTKQETYQGRWHSIPKVLRLSQRYPFMGVPFAKYKAIEGGLVETKMGYVDEEIVVTPHNLILEYLYLFGLVGLILGLGILVSSFKFIFGFLHKYKEHEELSNWGVSAFSAWVFTFFYSLCNVTTASPFLVFFTYFPLVLLMSVERINAKATLLTKE